MRETQAWRTAYNSVCLHAGNLLLSPNRYNRATNNRIMATLVQQRLVDQVHNSATQTESQRLAADNLHPDRLLYFASALDLATGQNRRAEYGQLINGFNMPLPPPLNNNSPGVTVFPMRSLPHFFHHLQNKFYFESYLWLYQNIMFHPRSGQTRIRMYHISRVWNVSVHDVAMATLSVHMMKFANLRQPSMHSVQSVLREVSQGHANTEMLHNLRGMAVDVCIHLNPRQMLRDFCKLIRDLHTAVCAPPDLPTTR